MVVEKKKAPVVLTVILFPKTSDLSILETAIIVVVIVIRRASRIVTLTDKICVLSANIVEVEFDFYRFGIDKINTN